MFLEGVAFILLKNGDFDIHICAQLFWNIFERIYKKWVIVRNISYFHCVLYACVTFSKGKNILKYKS